MKTISALALIAAMTASAQVPVTPSVPSEDSAITVRSSIVVVPALVRDKSNEVVYSLKAEDFLLTDNGVEQKLRLEEDTGDRPIALVVCVETGGLGAKHLNDYRNLTAMLETMVGGVEHRVAVVRFDSTPVVLHGFTPKLEFIANTLIELEDGDQGAAIFDGLRSSIDLLREEPSSYRRAVLLISETLDHGSRTKLEEVLRAVSDTNTVIYSVAFSSSRAELGHEAIKFGYGALPPLPPGPKSGCFSRDLGKDADGKPIEPDESKGAQDLDCIEEIVPPLRLARLAEISARDALRQNVSESVAGLTGGESYTFKDAKTLDNDLLTIANHIPNRYVLSLHPQSPAIGFHTIRLRVRNLAGLSVEARNGYWVEEPNAPAP